MIGGFNANGWVVDVDPKLVLRLLRTSLHSDRVTDSEASTACADLLRCLNAVGERLKVDPTLQGGWGRRDETWIDKTIRLVRLVDGELIMSEPVPIGTPAEILATAGSYFDDSAHR